MPSYEASEKGYKAMWAKASLTRRTEAMAVAKRVLAQWEHYQKAAERVGQPSVAPLIAAIHYREANLDLQCGLANGDPISRKTTHVPAGLGPYATFEDSALDAWRYEKFTSIKDWPIARWLWAAEKFNGFGYVSKGVNAPYDWAGTSLEQPGKYVADHVFSWTARDKQLGVVAVLKALFELRPDLAPPSPSVATTEAVAATVGTVVTTTAVTTGDHTSFAVGAGGSVLYLLAAWLYANHQEKPMFVFTSWKTSLAGIGALLVGAGTLATQLSSGHVDPNTIGVVATAIIGGIMGLAAKDGNVTGGTKQQ